VGAQALHPRLHRLPGGTTAEDYASWIEARFERPVDVIGFSTGGEVAQYFAADHGELVRRLVLSDTGCRLGEDAKALLRAARDKAAQGRAAEAHADIATTWTSDGSAKAW
jgi:pimeloyl-ACP methyl ester carboxylesterase